MSRRSFSIVAILALAATAAGCAPQCTCPATIPAPVGTPPDAANPSIPAPAQQPVQQQPNTVAGPLRILNEEDAEALMRRLYPQQLADAGVGADVLVDVTIASNGLVEGASDVRVSNDAFRGPALTVAHELRFVGTLPAPGSTVRVRMRWRTTTTSVEIVQP